MMSAKEQNRTERQEVGGGRDDDAPRTEVDDLWASIAVLLQTRTLCAVVSVRYTCQIQR